MKSNPYISVIMPTFNSDKSIEKTLLSIRNQDYPQDKIEILVIDGGSTDTTIAFAKKYDCVILNNAKKLPEFAKEIGFNAAKGDYCIFLDSDEILEKQDCFSNRIRLFTENPNIKNVFSSAVKTPGSFPSIVKYMNHTGDPFSFTLYRVNNTERIRDYSKKYKHNETNSYCCYYFSDTDVLPLIDAQGNMFETKLARNIYEKSTDKINFTSSVFDQMVSVTKCAGVVKNDSCIHADPSNLAKFLRKLDFRVKNNLSSTKAAVGFSSRAKINKRLSIKKYLFIPYCLFIVPLLADTIYIMIKDRAPYFIWHFFLSYFILFDIILTYFKKIFVKNTLDIKTYG